MPLVSAGPTETCVKAPDKSLEHSGSVVVPPISKDPVMLGPDPTSREVGTMVLGLIGLNLRDLSQSLSTAHNRTAGPTIRGPK